MPNQSQPERKAVLTKAFFDAIALIPKGRLMTRDEAERVRQVISTARPKETEDE